MRREGLQARGIYKEVPRPSRRLALATRQKIPYTIVLYNYKIAKLLLGPLVRILILIPILNYIPPRRLRLEA
jgi:hypothetical protein